MATPDDLIAEYVAHLNTLNTKYYTFATQPGKKFVKVTQRFGGPTGQQSVHAFVSKETGEVFKPSGWAAPAKGVRYDLRTEMHVVKAAADPYGSYLYAGFQKPKV